MNIENELLWEAHGSAHKLFPSCLTLRRKDAISAVTYKDAGPSLAPLCHLQVAALPGLPGPSCPAEKGENPLTNGPWKGHGWRGGGFLPPALPNGTEDYLLYDTICGKEYIQK